MAATFLFRLCLYIFLKNGKEIGKINFVAVKVNACENALADIVDNMVNSQNMKNKVCHGRKGK